MYLYDIKKNMFILNRFTCLPKQLGTHIHKIKSNNMLPIIDYIFFKSIAILKN